MSTTISGTTLSLGSLSYSGNVTSSYLGVTFPYISTNSNTFTLNTTYNITNNKINDSICKLIPIIENNMTDGEIADLAIRNQIYWEFASLNFSFNNDEDKKIKNYRALWEISKCNKGIWILYSRDDDSTIATICKELIRLVK